MINSGITDEQFSDFVKNSFSVAQVLRKMQKCGKGANYRTIYNRIERLNLDKSHFKGFGWSKGKKRKEFNKDIQLYLDNILPCESHKLKLRLISEGLMERKCYTCNLKEWMGQPIPIELDHVDGNRNNNNLNNLKIVCPNCHAQTPNYKAKNRKDKAKIKLCACGGPISHKASVCFKCRFPK